MCSCTFQQNYLTATEYISLSQLIITSLLLFTLYFCLCVCVCLKEKYNSLEFDYHFSNWKISCTCSYINIGCCSLEKKRKKVVCFIREKASSSPPLLTGVVINARKLFFSALCYIVGIEKPSNLEKCIFSFIFYEFVCAVRVRVCADTFIIELEMHALLMLFI